MTVTKSWCPNCRMTYRLGAPAKMTFENIEVSPITMAYLLAAALEFDETVEELTPGESFTAVDFMDWLRPILVMRKSA